MKALICGAGIAGLALAERLDAIGWQVTVAERAPGPRPQGYMIDFFGPGYDAARATGLLPRLHELGYQVQELAYRDAAGRRRAGLDFGRFAGALGGRLVSIMRPDLELALRERLPDTVELRFGAAVTALEQHAGGVRATLKGGEQVEADLLVGADGIHSAVRALVFGDERRHLRYLGFHTAAFVFDDAAVHAEVAGTFSLTDTAGRQMGFYGLRDGRVAAFAVHRAADPALPADPRAALLAAYAGLGWVVPRALAACPPGERLYYDQVAQVEPPAWSSGRVTLAGDACGAVSLLAGQGASLAVAGAYVLADRLARGGPVEAALADYERLWRPVVADKQRAARSGVNWFLPDTPLRLGVRRAALRLSALPGVDRLVAGALTGKSTALVTELAAAGDRRGATGPGLTSR
ncbi:FAD-dependent oxidoreductase [Sphaerisporangium rufum]|uniref:FAD-dependent oxidoreductase n=1 Tax=Sphaerisporangium rufum TaxID=1381558 RepID=A0A919R3Z4_9ACTN|nr:FAD-dependent monooxygenase [Sphaerisporangium rufum]GII77971.1 FAD-dependent oxidoreductase [Sphaerisporangium rufum]